MGLDITAVSKAKLIAEEVPDDYDWETQRSISQSLIDFSNSFGPRADDLKPGLYEFEEEVKFRAGSYSGYNEWRNELCKLIGYPSDDDFWDKGSPQGPFTELIKFADNEGYIGPAVSAKLLKDFKEFWDLARATKEPWFVGLYAIWQRAFELAADGGFVDFH